MSARPPFRATILRQYTIKPSLQSKANYNITLPSSSFSSSTVISTLLPPSCPRCLLSARRKLSSHFLSQVRRAYSARAAPSPTVRRNVRREKTGRTQGYGPASVTYDRGRASAERVRRGLSKTGQLHLHKVEQKLPAEIKNKNIECTLATAQQIMKRWFTVENEYNSSTVEDLCRGTRAV